MKCNDCKKKELCECCGKPLIKDLIQQSSDELSDQLKSFEAATGGKPANDTCTPPTVYRNDYARPVHDDFGDSVKAFRDRHGRNPRGEEWAMFI